MKRRLFPLIVFFIWALSGPNVRSALPEVSAETNSPDRGQVQDLLRSNLELQNQLHTALRAIEQARQDADTSAKKNAELFTDRINAVEKNLVLQRENYLESMVAMRQSNRFALIAAALVAIIGVLALFLTAYFLIRAMNRTAEIGALISAAPRESARLLDESAGIARLNSTDQVTARFFSALDQLEKRIHQLDFAHSISTGKNPVPWPMEKSAAVGELRSHAEPLSQTVSLLAEGQNFLNSGDAERALDCFEKATQLDPRHADAWVKKGTALEAQRKIHEAIECYDRAIGTDHSMTVAYLYKGGALNRLQRFSEAMECYERALRAHPKKGL